MGREGGGEGATPLTKRELLGLGYKRLEHELSTLTGVALVRAVSLLEQQVKEEEKADTAEEEAVVDVLDLLESAELDDERFYALANELEASLIARAERLVAIREARQHERDDGQVQRV